MTKQETALLMALLKEAYPNFYKNKSELEQKTAVNLWYKMLGENDVSIVQAAVELHIANNKFPPSIAEINEYISKLLEKEEATELEAWDMVRKALKNSLYNYEKEYEKLPTTIQMVIGSANQLRDWAMMDTDTVNSVVSSNFMRSYKIRAKSAEEFQRLPQSTKTIVGALADKFDMRRMLEDKNEL